ncbi:recombinase family protein [Mycobacterium sp. M1]|uniref:Recombinase family protein n=1 Tax=Mycolicibacter acidiphilus TaxID=2835306 RepID=A0ABS5RDM7_9MYCO|nr:recombinase family protein [Mycolicibacter acidiphilus]MBS9532390.1 recombinase family protein [Mycolicibacter acidiphilus]
MKTIGYARVSTDDQNTALQLDALRAAGVDAVYTDHGISGGTASRPELDAALAVLEPGDTLVVWRLDRLGRSLAHLVSVVEDLGQREIGFRSLTENIETASASGRLIFHVFASMAQFERELIRERTTAGLAAARARGVKVGRRAVLTADQVNHAAVLVNSGVPVGKVAESLGVGRSTLYRALSQIDAA